MAGVFAETSAGEGPVPVTRLVPVAAVQAVQCRVQVGSLLHALQAVPPSLRDSDSHLEFGGHLRVRETCPVECRSCGRAPVNEGPEGHRPSSVRLLHLQCQCRHRPRLAVSHHFSLASARARAQVHVRPPQDLPFWSDQMPLLLSFLPLRAREMGPLLFDPGQQLVFQQQVLPTASS